MKFFINIIFILLLNNCSFNNNSQYWTEDVEKRKVDQKKIVEILNKVDDITAMTEEEYKIYIDDYTKKSKYPNISK